MNYTAFYQSELRRIKNKRKRTSELKRKLRLCIAIFVLFIGLSFTVGNTLAQAQTKDSAPVYKYYASIAVQYGDTLWSIAEENISFEHYSDIKDFINEISRINHLSNDKLIAGRYLIVPYYSAT